MSENKAPEVITDEREKYERPVTPLSEMSFAELFMYRWYLMDILGCSIPDEILKIDTAISQVNKEMYSRITRQFKIG